MKRILIVDDEKGWRDYHSSVINKILKCNYKIDFAESAEAGYNLLIQNINNPYDVIFTDLQMEANYAPLMAGEWFINQIKSFPQYTNSKIVLISASYKIKYIADNLGVEYIPKTVARQDILQYKVYL